MQHNFDAAIEALNKHDAARHATILPDDAQSTIQFALKFTKAALSGEVSEGIVLAALQDKGRGGDIGTGFIAMCQQLAKEIG